MTPCRDAVRPVLDPGSPVVREEIASAWRRAEMCGLHPGSTVGETDLVTVDADSGVMIAARPVLDDVERQLTGTRFSVLLADRDSRIVDRRFGDVKLARSLDAVLAVPGNLYGEETTGTNALASSFETRREFAVHGEEHYLESLKGFTCVGCPITNPFTARIEGVVDITGNARDAHPLLSTVAAFAARAIERRLLTVVGRRQQAMLVAFQAGTARHRRPVVVFGDDLTLANDAAADMFDGPTRAALRQLAEETSARGGGRRRLLLPSGAEVTIDCRAVDGAPRAVLADVVDTGLPRRVIPRRRDAVDVVSRDLADARQHRRRVLVCGEHGTGRTHAVDVLVAGRPVLRLGVDDLTAAGPITQQLRRHCGPVAVEHLELLDDVGVSRLNDALDDCPSAWVVGTSVPLRDLGGAHRALAARFADRIELPPLRERRADIPRLAHEILARLRPDGPATLTPAAVRALVRWPWLGNMQELAAVLGKAVARRPVGELTADDLGLRLRTHSSRPLSPLEHAEAETVLVALRRANGNKSHAATQLGISRTTLYRRVRELGLE